MIKITVYDIAWDTDGDEELARTLPQSLVYDFPDTMEDDDLEDMLRDKITDDTGYCYYGFRYRKEQ